MAYYNLGSQNQSEVVLVYTMQEYGAVEVQFHLLLISMRVIGQLQDPVDFPPGNGPRKYLNRRPSGPYSRYGRSGKQKISFPFLKSNHVSSVIWLVV